MAQKSAFRVQPQLGDSRQSLAAAKQILLLAILAISVRNGSSDTDTQERPIKINKKKIHFVWYY